MWFWLLFAIKFWSFRVYLGFKFWEKRWNNQDIEVKEMLGNLWVLENPHVQQ